MSYLCDICSVAFDEPLVIKRTVRLNGWLHNEEEALCPLCATPYFSEADRCKCGEVKPKSKNLCRKCKRELLERVTAFFDELTAEEEEQFDEWMDGDTITNRKAWG